MNDNRITEIKRCLDLLIPRSDIILSFDRNLIDQLPDILRENFNVRNVSDASRLPALKRLLELVAAEGYPTKDLNNLSARIEAVGVNKAEYTTLAPSKITMESERAFSHWSTTKAVENSAAVLTLQRDLGSGQYNPSSKEYPKHWERDGVPLRRYLTGVTTVPPTLLQKLTGRSYWELRIIWWKWRGLLDETAPSLSVGPRWLTEIEFFRKVVGLRRHIGLDLHSGDQDLVKVGDMHAMPFSDSEFQLVFIKNTVDKSYDVRRLVDELVRVIKPGGIIVIDQICGFGDCSPLTRTDIQKSQNLLRLFQARANIKVLSQADVNLRRLKGVVVGDHSTNNARLAIQVRDRVAV